MTVEPFLSPTYQASYVLARLIDHPNHSSHIYPISISALVDPFHQPIHSSYHHSVRSSHMSHSFIPCPHPFIPYVPLVHPISTFVHTITIRSSHIPIRSSRQPIPRGAPLFETIRTVLKYTPKKILVQYI